MREIVSDDATLLPLKVFGVHRLIGPMAESYAMSLVEEAEAA